MARGLVTTLLALAAAGLAVGVYAGVLDNEFVWDDPIFFRDQLPSLDSLESAFRPPRGIPQFTERYYRPLVILSYQLDERVSRALGSANLEEARRLVYHATPVALHAMATVLVLVLGLAVARALGPPGGAGAWAAAVGATLFAVHPIHVESVAWMAGRSDVLCAVFALGALIALLGSRLAPRPLARRAAALAVPVLTLGAMLAKETGVGLLAVVPAVDVLVLRRRTGSLAAAVRRGLPAWLALAAAALAYLWLRRWGLALMETGGGLPPPSGVPVARAVFGSLGWYALKTVWPPPQSAFVAGVPGGVVAGLGFCVALGLGTFAVRQVLWAERPGLDRVAVGVVLFLGMLAPALALALFRISETSLAERYLYLPSAGACMAFGFLLEGLAARLPGSRTRAVVLATVAAAAIAAAAARATVARGEVWARDYDFWLDAAAKAPGQGLPRFQLGVAHDQRGELAEAEREYREAARLYDDREGRSKAYNNLGTLHLRQGRYEEALGLLERALAEWPDYPAAHFNRSTAYLKLADRAEGPARARLLARCAADLERALRLDPRYVLAHLQYGELLADTGAPERATRHLRRVIELAPGSARAAEARALLARLQGAR